MLCRDKSKTRLLTPSIQSLDGPTVGARALSMMSCFHRRAFMLRSGARAPPPAGIRRTEPNGPTVGRESMHGAELRAVPAADSTYVIKERVEMAYMGEILGAEAAGPMASKAQKLAAGNRMRNFCSVMLVRNPRLPARSLAYSCTVRFQLPNRSTVTCPTAGGLSLWRLGGLRGGDPHRALHR